MIRIMTDSTCDLPIAKLNDLNVEVIPLEVHFGGEAFRDGVDITNEEFYCKLSHVEELPSTSQVNPDTFVERFQARVNRGDQVVGVFLSSAMSGTYQSAVIAKDIIGSQEIHLVDSGVVTFALGLLVEQAARLRDEGLSAPEIAQAVSELSQRVRILAMVDTLKYLKMGGRISAATAIVGGLLGITPIIAIKNGLVEAVGKARGRKAAFQWMAKQMESEMPDFSLPVAFGSSNAPDALAECEMFFKEIIGDTPYIECQIGSVVGAHAGPGAAGIAYFTKK